MPEEYEDMNRMIEKMHPQPTPCELAAANDRLMQKVSALCKERDELRRSLNKEIVATGDAMLEISSLKKEIDKLRAENKRLIALARGAE